MIASDQLRSMYDRWSRLEEAKADIGGDLKDLFAEAKSNGYDPKAMRAAFRMKAMDANAVAEYAEHEALVDIYLNALGVGTDDATQARDARENTNPAAPTPTAGIASLGRPEAAKTAAIAPVEATGAGEAENRQRSRASASPSLSLSVVPDDDLPDIPTFLRRTA